MRNIFLLVFVLFFISCVDETSYKVVIKDVQTQKVIKEYLCDDVSARFQDDGISVVLFYTGGKSEAFYIDKNYSIETISIKE